jgi:two-component system LytT family sensor kinase
MRTIRDFTRQILSRSFAMNALILFGLFTFFGTISGIQMVVFLRLINQPHNSLLVFITIVLEWNIWALVTPYLWYYCQRNPLEYRRLLQQGFNYLFVSILVVIVKLLIDTVVVHYGLSSILGSFEPIMEPPNRGEPQSFWVLTIINTLSPKNFFNVLICWFIIAIIIAWQYYQQSKERQLYATQIKNQLIEAHLKTLQMQLQPHFLFNTLNSISSLLYDNVKAADEMINNLSTLLRMTLDKIGIQETTLQDEIELAQSYLDIEQVRFQDRLSVHYDIEKQVLKAMVPSLLLQPIVENSIRHGISKQAGKGTINIKAQSNHNRVELSVMNDGPVVETSKNSPTIEGFGLGVTRQRLEHMYGKSFELTMYHGLRGGTIVTIIVPYTEKPFLQTKHDETKPPEHSYSDCG